MGLGAGIFSVAPSVDASDYLTRSPTNFNQVVISALFQMILTLCYLGFAILVYPAIKKYGHSLPLGFLGLRIVAISLSLGGTLVSLSILALSNTYVQNGLQNAAEFVILGGLLKNMRDLLNHVFMVIMLCLGNIMLYWIFIRAKLLPQWMSLWGISGALLSIIASFLLLFKTLEIITPEYLILNAPTGIFELVLGFG